MSRPYLRRPGGSGGGGLRGLGAGCRLGGARGVLAPGLLRGQPVIAAVLFEGEGVGRLGEADLGAWQGRRGRRSGLVLEDGDERGRGVNLMGRLSACAHLLPTPPRAKDAVRAQTPPPIPSHAGAAPGCAPAAEAGGEQVASAIGSWPVPWTTSLRKGPPRSLGAGGFLPAGGAGAGAAVLSYPT